MPGLFDKLKSGAESARFEAERALRLQQAQSALNKLERDLDAQLAAIGQQVVALYEAGSLVQPELLAAGQQLDPLRKQIAQQQALVEQIKQEKATTEAAPAPAAAGRTCPNCGASVGADTRFCPSCGNSLQAAPKPAGTTTCPSCGQPIRANVAFCPECGARIPA
jgi:DNA repair exonuclease SbcCD ATPase subunit